MRQFGGRHFGEVDVAVKAPEPEAVPDLEYEVIGEMRRIRKLRPAEEDNFSINKLDTLMGAFNSVVGVVLLIGLLVTSIALFVGGIGVMNIMFVSVTERTREIGIRKAIGAQRHAHPDAVPARVAIICLIGGLIGIGLATLVTTASMHRADAGQPVALHHARRARRIGRSSAWSPASFRPGEAPGSTRSKRCATSETSA